MVLVIVASLIFIYLYLNLDIFADQEIVGDKDYSQTQIYYDFEGSYDQQSGEVVINDQIGNNNGVLTNPKQVSFGQQESNFGTYLDFKGKSSLIRVQPNNLEGFSDNFTLMAWFKPGQFNEQAGGKAISRKDSFALHFWRDRLIFDTWSKAGQRDSSLVYENIDQGKWFQLTAVFNRGLKQLFINGQLMSENRLNYQQVGGINNPIKLNGQWAGNYYNGALDEVRIFNYPLSREQVINQSKLPVEVNLESRKVVFSPDEKINLRFLPLNKDKSKTIDVGLLDNNGNQVYSKKIEDIDQEVEQIINYTYSGPPTKMSLTIEYSGAVKASSSQSIYFDQKRRLENLIYYGWWQKYGEIDKDMIDSLTDSPFDSFTPYLMSAYSDETLKIKDFKNSINEINSQKKLSRKEFWPRLFFNQIYSCSDNSEKNYQYCQQIKGIDLWDEQKQLTRLFSNYRTSLKIAKQTQASGVVIDNEAYNNKKLYNFDYLTKQTNRTKKENREALASLGSTLADITNEVYPDSKILFLFGHFHFDSTVRAITEGMLERAKEKEYQFKVIDGSEGLVWYLHTSQHNLRERIERQNIYLTKYVAKYPNLYLGGTKGLYLRADQTKGLWQDWYQLNKNNLEVNTIEDQERLLEDLFQSRKYVWLYGAGMAGENSFNEYDREKASPYDQVISQALCGNGYCEENRAETEQSCSTDCKKVDVDMGKNSEGGDSDTSQVDQNDQSGASKESSRERSEDSQARDLEDLIDREEFPSFKELIATGSEGANSNISAISTNWIIYLALSLLLLISLIGGIIYLKRTK